MAQRLLGRVDDDCLLKGPSILDRAIGGKDHDDREVHPFLKWKRIELTGDIRRCVGCQGRRRSRPDFVSSLVDETDTDAITLSARSLERDHDREPSLARAFDVHLVHASATGTPSVHTTRTHTFPKLLAAVNDAVDVPMLHRVSVRTEDL
jgi:hypothetical protein